MINLSTEKVLMKTTDKLECEDFDHFGFTVGNTTARKFSTRTSAKEATD